MALRRLLALFIWKPVLLITSPFRFLGLAVGESLKFLIPPCWRFVGRLGLALRHLLTWFVWRPARWTLGIPLSWIFRNLVWPTLVATVAILWRILIRFHSAIHARVRARWQTGAPWRRRRRRQIVSRLLVWRTRAHIWLRRPKPPATAVRAPRTPATLTRGVRSLRLATALAGLGAVLSVALLAFQEPVPAPVAADNRPSSPRVIVVTSTPGPVTATPIPEPTVALTPWPTPDPLSDGGTIAFSLHKDGNTDLYLLPVGQVSPIRLTSHPAADRDPAWSPDGSRLAFASNRDGNWEIYVYDFPTGTLRRMTRNPDFDGAPSWSPDSDWLVYETYHEGDLDLAIIKADLGQGSIRITDNPAHDFAPVWSPGGRHIAFTSWREGNRDIFVMSLDEVSDEAVSNLTHTPDRHEDDPAFAPDRRRISFFEESAGFPLIYALSLNQQYRRNGDPVSLGHQGRQLAWSPNGEAIIYVLNQGQQNFMMAGSPYAWGVSPQVFAADGRLGSPSWSAVNLPPEITGSMRGIDRVGEPRPLYRVALAEPQEGTPPVALWELLVNAPSPFLSDRVDESFAALRERLIQDAGWDVLGQLDNMFEPIDRRPLPGQSSRTWNKAGRAFDLYYREALAFEPRLEIVRVDVGSETYWRVYVLASEQDGTMGEPLRQLPWDFRARFDDDPLYFDQGGKLKEHIPAGYYVDFTAVAADYGWQWVPSAENWRTYFPGIRFWHYENRGDLTWEEAMRELYTEAEISAVFGQP